VAFEGTWVRGAAREKGGGRLGVTWGRRRRERGLHRRRRCCVTGEGGGVRATLARAGDRRDRATTGPSGQRRGAGGGGESKAARRWALTCEPGQHSDGARFKLDLNRFKSIYRFINRFKFLQTLIDPKGVFPYSKNWK
jgi:hypothetical protein